MFQQKLIQSLEEQVLYLKEQVKILQEKLFISTRLNIEKKENTKPMKYDKINKTMVEKTSEEIYQDAMALADLLSQNENPVLTQDPRG